MLMDVRRPDTGEALRRVGATGEAVAALDATFSAPKSVSAVWAIADPELRERIERAHETAIDRALAYATRQVPMLRRRVSQDTIVHEKATGLVATSWRHTTARAVADQPPDPQLHSHVLLHAAVRRDGQLVAIDSRSWLVHQREVGAAYRTELARELTDAGVRDSPRGWAGRTLLRARGCAAGSVGSLVKPPPSGPGRDPRASGRPARRARGDHGRGRAGRHRGRGAARAACSDSVSCRPRRSG